MSTLDVPGANPVNKDKLARGCWAEHEDGSLIYVKDIDENDRVIFEMYDLHDPSHPVYYPHALSLKDFEKTFSYDPKKVNSTVADIKWTWHDKMPMPWDKVMRIIDRPLPVSANIEDNLTATQRVARSLKTRLAQAVTRDHLTAAQGLEDGPVGRPAKRIRDRLKGALDALVN